LIEGQNSEHRNAACVPYSASILRLSISITELCGSFWLLGRECVRLITQIAPQKGRGVWPKRSKKSPTGAKNLSKVTKILKVSTQTISHQMARVQVKGVCLDRVLELRLSIHLMRDLQN